MRRATFPRRIVLSILKLFCLSAAASAATVFNATYEASTGVFPDAVCPPWTLFGTTPSLSAGTVTFSTSTDSQNSYFMQTAPTIVMPSLLVIEARMKLVAGSTSHPARAPAVIGFETAPNFANGLFIDAGEIFLLSGDVDKGLSAPVNTQDDFHTYRIEVDSSGSITVFYDGVLKLTGQNFSSTNQGNFVNIYWGEATGLAYGTSEWEMIRHNAGNVQCSGNQLPVANAGADQTTDVGTTVTLDGSGSFDPDGHTPLSFAWTIIAKPAGSAPTLANSSTALPSFTPDLPGDYTIELIVFDSLGAQSTPDTVQVSTTNSPPVADAGPDQAIGQIGTLVQLDGTASYDLDGDLPLTYFWSLDQTPLTSNATLSDPSHPSPTFVADVHGDYVISLVVTDSIGAASQPDTVLVSFLNVPPVADAGNSQSVVVGTTVVLDGSRSFDANGDPLTYTWQIVSRPARSTAALDNPGAVMPSFVPDWPGLYIVSLVVNDGFVDSSPSSVTITATATPAFVLPPLQDLLDLINLLPPGAIKNPKMKTPLTNKINAVINDIEQGLYQQALDKLQNDILPKTDGCAAGGVPDANDWITDCAAQARVYPLVIEAMERLRTLL